MSGSESSFDDLIVDFDDDYESGNSFGIGDHRGEGGETVPQCMPRSVTSPSPLTITTGSTSFMNCGPNSSITSSEKWVLGVRHLSLASNTLNQRMAKRGKHFGSDVYNSNNYLPKRDTKFSLNHRMDAIEEDSAESFDAMNLRQINSTVDNQKNGFNKMNEKRLIDRQVKNGLKTSRENCERFVCQPICHKPNGVEINKLPTIQSKSNAIIKSHSTNRDNAINDINSGKRTKICDKINGNLDKNKIITKILPINKEICDQNKTSIKLSTNFKRSVNSLALSAEQELQRYRHQKLCETVSLITLIFGLLLVIFTPFLLIPIWVIPNPYSALFRNLFWISLLTSVVLMSLASLTGNIYWYYDPHQKLWKWFFHVGKGPGDHYWGATLLHNHKPVKPLAKLRANLSINV